MIGRTMNELEAREFDLRARVQSLIEESGLPVCITEDDRIVHANRAAVRAVEAADAQDLRGRLAWQVLYPSQVEKARDLLAPRPGHGAPGDGEAAPPPFVMQAVASSFQQRRRLVDELDRSRNVLREMSARVEQAREEDRRLIARQLHDELGQQLSMMKMQLSALTRDPHPAPVREIAREVSALVDRSVATVRQIVSGLRPLMLDDLGLNAAVEWLAHQVARSQGIGVTVRLSDAEPAVSDEAANVLFRLAQEALANAVQHAQATALEVSLTCRDESVCLTVQDNGIGLPDDALDRPGTLGLKGMRERVAMLGGQFLLDNAAGAGARVRVRLPLRRPPAQHPAPTWTARPPAEPA